MLHTCKLCKTPLPNVPSFSTPGIWVCQDCLNRGMSNPEHFEPQAMPKMHYKQNIAPWQHKAERVA
jgi:ribosomal protein L37AE/L43A